MQIVQQHAAYEFWAADSPQWRTWQWYCPVDKGVRSNGVPALAESNDRTCLGSVSEYPGSTMTTTISAQSSHGVGRLLRLTRAQREGSCNHGRHSLAQDGGKVGSTSQEPGPVYAGIISQALEDEAALLILLSKIVV